MQKNDFMLPFWETHAFLFTLSYLAFLFTLPWPFSNPPPPPTHTKMHLCDNPLPLYTSALLSSLYVHSLPYDKHDFNQNTSTAFLGGRTVRKQWYD